MKNILTTLTAIVILLMCSFSSNASHLMGGDIWVEKDSIGFHFLRHTNYRDMLGVPAYSQTDFRVFKWHVGTSTWAELTYVLGNPATMPLDLSIPMTVMAGVPYGVEVYNYRSNFGLIDNVFNLGGPGKYRFYTDDCCRNAAIQNTTSPGTGSMIIYCEYEFDSTLVNTSPRFLAEPIFYGPVNTPWSYNPFPFDADADSLSWVVDTPICSATLAPGPVTFSHCPGYTTPASATAGPFTLNSVTGQLNWTPSMTGNFVASFKIKEYRNGVEIGHSIRDMQYIVVNDTNSNGPVNIPSFTSVTGFSTEAATGGQNNSYNYLYYTPGTQTTFTIAAADLNNNDVLSMQAIGNLFTNGSNAAFSYSPTGIGNTVNGTFNWTPALNDAKDFMIVIRANDGSFSKDFTLVLKKLLIPDAVNDLSTKGIKFVAYPNPTKVNSGVNFKIDSKETMRDLKLQIIDISGKVVAMQKVNAVNAGTSNIQVEAVLQSGFYFAKFTDRDGAKSKTIKFVVQ